MELVLRFKSYYVLMIIFSVSISSLFSSEKSYSAPDCRGVPLDHKLIQLMQMRDGFFIEVGANDGIRQSNTKLLEENYGWNGILIEPSPTTFQRLLLNRPKAQCFQCALGSFEKDNTYIYGDFDGNLMSSSDGKRLSRPATVKVLVRSLQSILDEVGVTHINFFSLDTEGMELNILKGIDFEKTIFDYILIEIYSKDYEEIVDLMLKHGYVVKENFSNYSLATNPHWDGSHNDYLFVRQ